jgi:hypothetical protein
MENSNKEDKFKFGEVFRKGSQGSYCGVMFYNRYENLI